MSRISNALSVAAAVAIASATLVASAEVPHMTCSTDSATCMKNDMRTTGAFSGKKVNGGSATLMVMDGKRMLTLSDDFKIPDAPAPHWQIVDSKGNVYLLNRLTVKADAKMPDPKTDRFNKTIALPAYVPDVARVQIWCAWAESLLGEAQF